MLILNTNLCMVNDWSGVRLFLAKKINTECSSRVTLGQKLKLMFTIVTTVPLRFIKKRIVYAVLWFNATRS